MILADMKHSVRISRINNIGLSLSRSSEHSVDCTTVFVRCYFLMAGSACLVLAAQWFYNVMVLWLWRINNMAMSE